MEESKKSQRKIEQELVNKRAILDALSKEQKDANVRLEQVQNELKLIDENMQTQDYEVFFYYNT